jgi:hypothetical protein
VDQPGQFGDHDPVIGADHRTAPARWSRRPWWVAPLGLLLAALATVAVIFLAARPAPLAAPTLSRQISAIPPLQNITQDQGNSVALPDGRTLWIFADTAQLSTRPRFFVTSSAGIAAGTDVRLRYLTNAAGVPIEFLPRTPAERTGEVPGERYTAVWPTGATTLPDGRILIAYAKYAVQMRPKPTFTFLAGGLFTYRYPGWSTAPGGGVIKSDGSNQPAERFADDLWTPQDGPIASPIYSDGYVYFSRCEDSHCYSVRSSVPGLADRTAYRWWTGSDWSPEVSRRAPMTFGSDVPGPNPSIGWSATLNLFVIADTASGWLSAEGLLWVARHPWGPWSRAASFALPDCPAGGCYTLNVHPDRSPPGTIRVSFATNGIGPYVRVVDVPVQLDPADTSGPADPPQIRTHDSASNCAPPTLRQCQNL